LFVRFRFLRFESETNLKPVIAWIHGGSLVVGSTTSYDGFPHLPFQTDFGLLLNTISLIFFQIFEFITN
jgi:hypothetical protein